MGTPASWAPIPCDPTAPFPRQPADSSGVPGVTCQGVGPGAGVAVAREASGCWLSRKIWKPVFRQRVL